MSEIDRDTARRLGYLSAADPEGDPSAENPAARPYFNPLARNRSVAARLRWWLLPYLCGAWRYRDEWIDAPNPGRWWHHCWGSIAYCLDEALDRLPSGAMYPPMPPIECDCDYCRGVPGARFEP